MKHFALTNATIVTENERFEGTVIVQNGIIESVKKGKAGTGKLETHDLSGKYLFPGLIDVHVHFRTPGMTAKEDWITGSKAALAGGVTTVLDMPNTKPPTVDASSLMKKRAMVKAKAMVNYGFYVGATHDNVPEIKRISDIAGIKVYMGSSTGSLLVDDKLTLEKLLNDKKNLFAIHAESEECLRQHAEHYRDTDDPGAHSALRPPECAYEAVREVLHLAKKYGTRIHLCHVSTEKELDSVRKFKSDRVTTEVTPHHLFLNDQDYARYGNLVKVNPPLREVADQMALWEGIRDGTVDMIATDHAPHLLEEKEAPYDKVPSGVPGVQTMLPLLLNAVNEGHLTIEKVAMLTSYNPARLFGIQQKGKIEAGMDADLTVVDMNLMEKVCHKYLWTKGDWSPFHGWVLQGWPVMTFVNGELMYSWRNTFGSALGKEVRFDRK